MYRHFAMHAALRRPTGKPSRIRLKFPVPCLLALALWTAPLPGIGTALSDELPDPATCNILSTVDMEPRIAGWCLMIAPDKGDCLACHHVIAEGLPDGLGPSGNIGPPLGKIAEQYPERSELVELLNDPGMRFPDTVMPPYGKHRILSGDEIDRIAVFLSSL